MDFTTTSLGYSLTPITTGAYSFKELVVGRLLLLVPFVQRTLTDTRVYLTLWQLTSSMPSLHTRTSFRKIPLRTQQEDPKPHHFLSLQCDLPGHLLELMECRCFKGCYRETQRKHSGCQHAEHGRAWGPHPGELGLRFAREIVMNKGQVRSKCYCLSLGWNQKDLLYSSLALGSL